MISAGVGGHSSYRERTKGTLQNSIVQMDWKILLFEPHLKLKVHFAQRGGLHIVMNHVFFWN